MAAAKQKPMIPSRAADGSVLWLIVVLLTASIAARAGEARLKRYEYSEVAMGVRTRIVAYAPNQGAAARACRAAFDRIAYLEDVMSDYRPTSELMTLCSRAGGPPVPVSKELLFILNRSLELSRRSEGAFDVTVGPLVRLWRTARKTGVLPTDAELDQARKLVGWRKLIIDPMASTVRMESAGMLLDLGGIAKGYACDEALRVLEDRGIRSALVEMGGDIVVGDAPPGRSGWEIEIPQDGGKGVPRRFCLVNAAISASGDTEQFVEIGGRRYSHIVDPRTGLGLTERIGVTVVAPNGMTSDGLSTAISVLGAAKGRELAQMYPGTRVYITIRTLPTPGSRGQIDAQTALPNPKGKVEEQGALSVTLVPQASRSRSRTYRT